MLWKKGKHLKAKKASQLHGHNHQQGAWYGASSEALEITINRLITLHHQREETSPGDAST